ncbi:hypothetical protein Srufu_068860 [Streptomyces libani subsp. rufus]|nr:hypothetical protein Srufu_068860 [Streptomyces libani subsp. rufus]
MHFGRQGGRHPAKGIPVMIEQGEMGPPSSQLPSQRIPHPASGPGHHSSAPIKRMRSPAAGHHALLTTTESSEAGTDLSPGRPAAPFLTVEASEPDRAPAPADSLPSRPHGVPPHTHKQIGAAMERPSAVRVKGGHARDA